MKLCLWKQCNFHLLAKKKQQKKQASIYLELFIFFLEETHTYLLNTSTLSPEK